MFELKCSVPEVSEEQRRMRDRIHMFGRLKFVLCWGFLGGLVIAIVDSSIKYFVSPLPAYKSAPVILADMFAWCVLGSATALVVWNQDEKEYRKGQG